MATTAAAGRLPPLTLSGPDAFESLDPITPKVSEVARPPIALPRAPGGWDKEKGPPKRAPGGFYVAFSQ